MYVWNPNELWNMAVLPRKAGDALKLANLTQLKVLLWIATNGQNGVDAASCAAALGGRFTEADCADALAFWQSEGVLAERGAAVPAPAATPAPVPAPAPTPVAPAAVPDVPKPAPVVKTLTAADAAIAAATPQPLSRKEYLTLVETVEARFGKTLSRADQERLWELCDTTALPLEVLMMVVGNAAANEKKSVGYVCKVARSWEEKDLTTIDAVDAYLLRMEQRERAWDTVVGWLELSIKRPSVQQRDLAFKWLCEWDVSQPLLKLAFSKCAEATGKFQASYIDRVLEGWREDGITSPEQVTAPRGAKPAKSRSPKEGGFDVEKYEKMLTDRSLRLRKKED